MSASITFEEYFQAESNLDGFCVDCAEFTSSNVEPDAEGYACPECDGLTVYGAEQCLILGLFDISEGGAR